MTRFTLLSAALAFTLSACERPIAVIQSPILPAQQEKPTKDTSAAAQFAAARTPGNRPTRVFGSYTKGCISGASQLSAGAGRWQILNPSRNRAWGHPSLINFISTLADSVAADGFQGLLLGDMAQPRGGPLPSDHNSHQVGLDVDIWLTPMPNLPLSALELESFEPPSMVDIDRLAVNPRFGAAQISMLTHAAQAPEVERIFVSPPIKQAICDRTAGTERVWLRKIRPWRGHMSHMHVRLACPTDSDDCKEQEPPPEGDGCGAELASWFKDASWLSSGSAPYVPEKALRLDQLPEQCQLLLKERG